MVVRGGSLRLALDELDLAVEGRLQAVREVVRLDTEPVRHRLAGFVPDERDRILVHGRVHALVDVEIL